MHFQDVGAYGRLVHLQPMKWVDDWPVIGVDLMDYFTLLRFLKVPFIRHSAYL